MASIMKSERILEDSLSAFAHRFPVSGRIVHAVSTELGGVIALSEKLEKNGLWADVEGWIATGKPTTLSKESVNALFDAEEILNTARHLNVPRESVEIQLALGIPKFFASLADEESLKKNPKRVKVQAKNRGLSVTPP